MKRLLAAVTLTGVAGLMGVNYGSVLSEAGVMPTSYQLPIETASFKPGSNLEVVQNNCTACHSADYVQTQPRGPNFKEDFWRSEVNKMVKIYGAPIDEADVSKIVEYLSQAY